MTTQPTIPQEILDLAARLRTARAAYVAATVCARVGGGEHELTYRGDTDTYRCKLCPWTATKGELKAATDTPFVMVPI